MTGPDDEVVYAICSTHRHEGWDNRPVETTQVEEGEGWFSTRQAAQHRVDQLNASLQQAWQADEDRRRREVDKKRRDALQLNREAAAIRAAGMRKADVKVPQPYPGRTFEQWSTASTSLTVHCVVELPRSEHDTALTRAPSDHLDTMAPTEQSATPAQG